MQANDFSLVTPRQAFRRTSRSRNIAARRLVLAAEAEAAAATDPAIESTYEQLATQLAHLAARARSSAHPREQRVR